MKKILQGILIASFGFLVSAFTILSQQVPTKAASGTKIYLTPASTSVTTGNNFTYTIMIDTAGETINAVAVRLNYDQSKVSFVSLDGSSSAFTVSAADSSSNGVFSNDRGALSPVKGVAEIAKVTFRANTAGNASFTFANGTLALSGGTNNLGTTSGGSATINGTVTPPPPPPSPPPPPNPNPAPATSTNGNSTKSTSSSTTKTNQVSTKPNVVVSTPTVQKTSSKAPNISNIKAIVGYNTITVSFTTDQPTRSTIEYGLNSKLGLTASDSELKSDHSISLNVDSIKPGQAYYYRIKATTANGEVATTDTINVYTKGYTIRLLIKDIFGRGITDLPITLRSDPIEGVTDAQGIVVYDNISPGKHTVETTYKGQTYKNEINVKDTLDASNGSKSDENSTIPVQTIPIVLRSSNGIDSSLIFLIAGIGLVIGLLGLGIWWILRVAKRSHHDNPSQINDKANKLNSNNDISSMIKPNKSNSDAKDENIFKPNILKENTEKSDSSDNVDPVDKSQNSVENKDTINDN